MIMKRQLFLEERGNKLKEQRKYIKARKNNKICNITDEELMNFIVRGRKLYHEASNNEKDCAKKCMSCIYSYVHMGDKNSLCCAYEAGCHFAPRNNETKE